MICRAVKNSSLIQRALRLITMFALSTCIVEKSSTLLHKSLGFVTRSAHGINRKEKGIIINKKACTRHMPSQKDLQFTSKWQLKF